MSTITGAIRHVFPTTTDDTEFRILGSDTTQADTTSGDGQGDRTITGNEWLDVGNIHISSNTSGLIARNALLRVTGITFAGGTIYDPDVNYIDFEDCVIEVYGNNDTVANASFQGGVRIENCTIIKMEGTARDILGNFGDGTRGNNNLQMTNCDFVGSSSTGPFHLLTQNLSQDSNLTGTAFVGNAQPEMPAGFGLGGVTVSNIGSDFELPGINETPLEGDAAAGIRWGIRHTHHLTNGVAIFSPSLAQSTNVDGTGETAGASRVSTVANFPSASYTPMSNVDFSAGIPGITINRNVSAWYINPIPQYVGADRQNISVTYHNVNGPWVGGEAEIRTFTGWRPVAREGNALVGDYMVHFPSTQIIVRPQATYDPFTIPTDSEGAGQSYFVTDTDTGFWIQDRRYFYSVTVPADQQAGGLPALQPLSAVPFRQYSFTHNLTTINDDIPTRGVNIAQGVVREIRGSLQNGNAGLVEQTLQIATDALVGNWRMSGSDIVDGGDTLTTSSALTTLDQAYAVLKSNWYQTRANEEWSIAGDAANTTITLGRDLDILTTGNTANLAAGDYEVRSVANGLVAGTLINRVVLGGNTIDFDSTRLFANTTFVGGTLTDFRIADVINVTFEGTPTLNFLGGTHDLTGWDARGRFTPSGTGVTLEVTSDQALEFFGSRTATTAGTANITVVGDPVFLTAEINTGNFCYRIGGNAIQGPFDLAALPASDTDLSVMTQANLIPGQNNQGTASIAVWYLPASTVNGVGGETETVIYDFNRFDWDPTTGSQTLSAFQPDASLLLFGAVNAAGYTATTLTPSASLDAGVAQFTISDGDQTGIVHNAAQTQGLAVKMLQSTLYLDAVCIADLENNQRLVSPAPNNGLALNTAMNLIRLDSSQQRQISNVSGIVATLLGSVPSVVSLTITLASATVQQIRDNTISEQQVADLINQQSQALQGATTPGKGIINTPDNVTP